MAREELRLSHLINITLTGKGGADVDKLIGVVWRSMETGSYFVALKEPPAAAFTVCIEPVELL